MSSPYETKTEQLTVGGVTLTVRSLKDRNQYWDPTGSAEAAGFGDATWSLFGSLWPAARVLAAIVQSLDVAGRRVLEVGAGLGLASLVLHQRGASVTASDGHPLSGEFIAENARLNGLGPLPFRVVDWAKCSAPVTLSRACPEPVEGSKGAGESRGCTAHDIGTFDLIVGSDVLYDHGQAESLSRFLSSHLAPGGEAIVVDPNRGHRARFSKLSRELSLEVVDVRAPERLENGEAFKGHVVRLKRVG